MILIDILWIGIQNFRLIIAFSRFVGVKALVDLHGHQFVLLSQQIDPRLELIVRLLQFLYLLVLLLPVGLQ